MIKIIDIDINEFKKYKQKIATKKNHSSENELAPTVQKMNYPSSENELDPSSENELTIEPSIYEPSIEPLKTKEKRKKKKLNYLTT